MNYKVFMTIALMAGQALSAPDASEQNETFETFFSTLQQSHASVGVEWETILTQNNLAKLLQREVSEQEAESLSAYLQKDNQLQTAVSCKSAIATWLTENSSTITKPVIDEEGCEPNNYLQKIISNPISRIATIIIGAAIFYKIATTYFAKSIRVNKKTKPAKRLPTVASLNKPN